MGANGVDMTIIAHFSFFNFFYNVAKFLLYISEKKMYTKTQFY